MKRKNNPTSPTPKQPAAKEEFLKELDEAELKKANGGFGVCMNGCGGRCGGCNCINTAAPSSGGWW